MSDQSYDVIVIGGGPGGYVCAIRAAQLGLKTALIEKEPALGGTCLHRGCIPTKALLRTAEVYANMKHAAEFGLKADNVGFDLDAVVKRSRKVAAKLSGGVGYLMLLLLGGLAARRGRANRMGAGE
jgi:dihydrolipoamide dehydrogenase